MKNKRTGRRSKKKIALAVICGILAVFFLVIMPVMSVSVYQGNFGTRFETVDWAAFSPDDFDGLKVTECTFESNDGQQLAGYQYTKDDLQARGVVVLAHGLGGGGQNTYMDLADFFTSNGYYVFAYDVTGNDKSEGDSIKGLPQGIIDLDYALRYVKAAQVYAGLPIVLFGHSWGGYSVGGVLNCHPDVKAAVAVAGFDSSVGMFEQEGGAMIGASIRLFLPYVSLYERVKFGKYAGYTASDGFGGTDAGIMIIHSRDDKTVLTKNGYDIFFEMYGGDDRFSFVEYEDRGHDSLYYSDAARSYLAQLYADYDDYAQANGRSAELMAEYMTKNRDKNRCCELDGELMGQILDFYDRWCL